MLYDGAEKDEDRSRMEAVLYAPPRGEKPRRSRMTPAAAAALVAEMASEDRELQR